MGERPEVRLGQLAVQAGLVTENEIELALLEQARRLEAGEPAMLGELLAELGLVTAAQLERLLGAQAVAQTQVSRIGPYRLIAKLGEGGMGAVYQARDLRTGGLVSLKVLPRSKALDPEFLARFEAEARAVFELDHPNIVKAVGLGEADGYHYLAMEYVEGRDVYDILDEQGRIAEPDALSIVIQIVQALDHAAEEQLVHRDVKPGNILVDRHGVAKLTDFGLALDRDRVGRGRITEGQEALGTPFYLSPEQARAEQDVDVRSDIYSLGATFYEMVTGRPPFEGSPVEVMSQHLSGHVVSPRDIDRTLSPGLCHVIQKMMAKDRQDRYLSPQTLLKDLLLVYQGKPPVSERVPSEKSSVRSSIRPEPRRGASERAVGVFPRQRAPLARLERPPLPRGNGGPAAVRADHGAPALAARAAQRSHDRRDRHERHGRERQPGSISAAQVAVGAGLVAALVIGAGLGRWLAGGNEDGALPAGGLPVTPPSAGGVRLMCDFESGTPEGWEGVVLDRGAGSGRYCLSVPEAGPPAAGLATRAGGLAFVADDRIEIAFQYYLKGRGPLVVEFEDAGSGVRLSHSVQEPSRGRWAVARLERASYVGADGLTGSLAGRTIRNVRIAAPGCVPGDALALDAIWVWSGR